MEQHKEVEIETQNEKEEEIMSTTPDSGVSLVFEDEKLSSSLNSVQDAKDSEKPSPPAKQTHSLNPQARIQNTLYPFYYKYPDNRKLTLLKSLSQDSEYSLDTSLFDAEDFLQEMGFAGSCDPTIPDRFLPSLMQRLSEFPESEMESLNDRIVQSIGCFKRKEGKRRLFRNLSMGKNANADQSDKSNLAITNSYPLIRSNTGPASFPFNETSLDKEGSQTPRISKTNSNNSSDSSFGDEEYFPESPIAILVSEASVDIVHEEKGSQNNLEKELAIKDEAPNASDIVSPNNYPTQSIPEKDKEENKFSEADHVAQNEENKIDDLENFPPTKENTSSLELEEIINQSNHKITENSETTQHELHTKTNSEDYNSFQIGGCRDNSTFESFDTKEITSHTTEPSSLEDSVKFSVVKHPLRRISQGTNFNILNSSYLGSLVHQTKIDICDSLNVSLKEIDQSCDKSYENNTKHSVDSLIESSESVSIDEKDIESFNEIMNQKVVLNTNREMNSFENTSNLFDVEMTSQYSKINKPIYNRDDSLTNFLSSMLDTNDDSLSPNSPEASQTFNFDCASITKATNSPSTGFPPLNPFTQKESSVKTTCDIYSNKNVQNASDKSKLSSHQVKGKGPNRKRRMLRRMSSSFNYGDEEASVKESKTVNLSEYIPQEFSSSTKFLQPKIPLRNSISAPQISNCPLMYPCCCLPAMTICSYHEPHDETILKNCSDFNLSTPCGVGNKLFERVPHFPSNRKVKHKCKRNRYFSCPPSMMNFGCNKCCCSRPLSNSVQNLHSPTHCHVCHHSSAQQPPFFTLQQSHWPKDSELKMRTIPNYQGGYSSDPQNPENWNKCYIPFYKHSPRNNSNLLRSELPLSYQSMTDNPSKVRWSSTPDVRRESETFPNHNNDLHFQRRHRINGSSVNNHTSGMDSSTSSSRDMYSQDDVFIPDPVTRFSSSQKENPCNDMYKVPFSQRKNNLTERSRTNPIGTSSSPKVLNMIEKFENSQIASQHSSGKTNYRRNMPLKASSSYPLPNSISSSDGDTPQQRRRMYSMEESNLVTSNSREHLNSQNIKREAFLEKKIRVFSKFLTNLGNLSKSVSDDKFDNDHKSTSESKYHDFVLPDKTVESHLYNNKLDKQVSYTDKCRTSSPELDKLLKILNSMDLNKTSDGYKQAVHQNSVDADAIKKEEIMPPVYENSIFLDVKDQGCQQLFTPVSYTSSISMRINDGGNEPYKNRSEKELRQSASEDNYLPLKRNTSHRRYSIEMPFKEVSKELEELQISIRKAKEMRISASKELHLLQVLLSRDTCEDHEPVKEKKKLSISYEEDVLNYPPKATHGALADLRQKSTNGDSDEAVFWQEEMKKMKKENDAAWRAKLDRMEEKLISQEEEMSRLHSENGNLQKQLELQTSTSPTCHCRTDVVQNGVGRTDSAFEDDEEYMNHKSSIPIQSSRQECERLQEQLFEAEQRTDQLNLLLNQKLIELNKLQLTYSKQTKEMIELEKSYLQLQCRLRKGTSKPTVTKLCSRTSPFNSKNLCPKPSPPASPHPNGVS